MTKKKSSYRPILPGEILKEELDARGWTQADFAEITGKPLQAINEIIAGKKAITPGTAILFSEALGTSPEFWLNAQKAVDIYEAAKSIGKLPKPIVTNGHLAYV